MKTGSVCSFAAVGPMSRAVSAVSIASGVSSGRLEYLMFGGLCFVILFFSGFKSRRGADVNLSSGGDR